MKIYSLILVCICLLGCGDVPVPKVSKDANLYLSPNPAVNITFLSKYNSSDIEFPLVVRLLNDVGEQVYIDSFYYGNNGINLRDEKDGKYFVIAEATNGDIILPLIKVSE
jgi:hypothetical protein